MHVNHTKWGPQLYLVTLKDTSKEGLELLSMLQALGVPCVTKMWDPSHYRCNCRAH